MDNPTEIRVDSKRIIDPVNSLITDSNIEKNLFEYFQLYYFDLDSEPIGKFSKDILNIIYSGKAPDNYNEIYSFYRPSEFLNKVYKILSNIRILVLNQMPDPNIYNVRFVKWEDSVAIYEEVKL